MKKHGHAKRGKISPEFWAWQHMIGRCYYPKVERYQRYGGRGIKVCERWLGNNGFENFISDMGLRPTEKHSLGRIKNDEDYSPHNCRWETREEQIRNRSNTLMVYYNGETKPLPEWCEIYGLHYRNTWSKLRYRSLDDIINKDSLIFKSTSNFIPHSFGFLSKSKLST